MAYWIFNGCPGGEQSKSSYSWHVIENTCFTSVWRALFLMRALGMVTPSFPQVTWLMKQDIVSVNIYTVQFTCRELGIVPMQNTWSNSIRYNILENILWLPFLGFRKWSHLGLYHMGNLEIKVVFNVINFNSVPKGTGKEARDNLKPCPIELQSYITTNRHLQCL